MKLFKTTSNKTLNNVTLRCNDLFTFFILEKELPFSSFVTKPRHPLAETQTEPCKAERSFSSPSQTGQVGRLHRWRQSGSTFRHCIDSSDAKLDTNHLEHHSEGGWVHVWVGGQIKRNLKSSWQLVKMGREAVCHGWAFER